MSTRKMGLEEILMSTHNIGLEVILIGTHNLSFYGELAKLIFKLSSNIISYSPHNEKCVLNVL